MLATLALGLAANAATGVYLPRWFAAPAKTAATPAPAPSVIRVEVAKVEEKPFARRLSAVGSLRSDESVVLRPEVVGRIQHIDFKEGESVSANQVRIRLDDAIPGAELRQAKANLALAESQYRRAVDLHGRGFVSQQARDESTSNLKVQQAAAALAQARRQNDDTRALCRHCRAA